MFRRLHASSFGPLASFVAVLAVSLLALGLGRPALAGSWENLDEVIQKRGAIAIGIGYSTPPMNYLDDQGQHAGFDVDLAKALAERMHLRYTVVKVNNKTRQTVDEPGFMLDVDVYMDGNIEMSHTAAGLNIVHTHADNIFRGAITDTLHDAMDPQEI